MYSSKRPLTALVTPFLLIVCGQHRALGQPQPKPKILFTIVSQTPLPTAAEGAKRVVLEDAKGVRLGVLLARQEKRVLIVPDRAEVILPHDLPALVARNGSVVLQYGDTLDLSHPRVTHLYWLDAQGKQTGQLEGYFQTDALVGLSDDGYAAVAGSRVEAPQAKVLSLFSPRGERIWERLLSQDRAIHAEPVVALQGQRVAAITTDAQEPLKDHRILILDEKNDEVRTIGALGTVQRMVVVGQSKALFVQARDRHGLIRLSDGSTVWMQQGNVRLISPFGAALSPNGDILFLLLADWSEKPQPAYPWRLKALDAADGQEIGMVQMPKPMAGTRSDVFGRISADQVSIFTDADQISVSWSR